MSRARNIKPGFFKNEILVELPFEVRLLFIGLWTMADREGRMEDRPLRIKMELFAADPVDVDDGLHALHEKGFIERYVAGESKYIQILEFKKHQNPHMREPASAIPASGEHDASTVQAPDEHRTGPADSPSLIPDSKVKEPNPDGLGVGLSSDAAGATDLLNGSTDAKPKRKACPIAEIVALYHASLPTLPKTEKVTKARAGYLRQRWLQDLPTLDAWRNYFTDVGKSPFLTGKVNGRDGKPPFVADLEWLSRPGNFAKVAEGRYHRE